MSRIGRRWNWGKVWLMAACLSSMPHAPGAAALISLKLQPMTFSLVKGKSDACGPGCAEWIAAQGDFDIHASDRLRDLLGKVPNSRLPVFFNSRGGTLTSALLVGELLRTYDMTVGIGRTISEPGDTGHEAQYRLEYRDAICASACAYAFLGASSREVAPAARLGIHNARATESTNPTGGRHNKLNDALRVYAISKGVDPALIDLAAKIPNSRVYWLTPNEMIRYGILSDGPFETPWQLFANRGRYSVIKSLTRGVGAARQTTVIEITCQTTGAAGISIGRELTGREIGSQSILRLKSDDLTVWDSSLRELAGIHASDGRYDRRQRSIAFDFLPKIAMGKALSLEEFFAKPGYENWTRVTTLSSNGLKSALAQMSASCDKAPAKSHGRPAAPH